ncbi:MAG: hypothetical protein KBT27_03440 [Prevotellaceae bacterium]|nr:hypothetical protein [Candidatus Faecinaster equi]
MIDSILSSVKMSIGGIDEGYTDFDDSIIQLINTQFAVLQQLGVGPAKGFRIQDKSTEWSEFINDDRLNMVRDWMAIRVRLLFDPPQSSIVMESLKDAASELEWRMNIEAENMDGDD